MQNLPPIQVGGQLTKSQYQLALQSPDTAELYRDSMSFMAEMSKLPGLQDVTTDLLIANPQVNVNIDRDKASALGVSAQQVEDALSWNLKTSIKRTLRLSPCSTFIRAAGIWFL
jgi:hydrophobic/amphiphilic exporter-1 (mainly G- bacteria), HAE1 family